jgi:DNA replication and repair protein RecF
MSDYKIERIQVTNFRNLNPDVVTFKPGINCIFGLNGNGKTNLLEALYVLTHRKSFRKNSSFPQYLSMDGDTPQIIINSAFRDENGELCSYSSRLESNGSTWSINGKSGKKKLKADTVFINPFDSYSFYNNSAFRRNWFDHHISLIDSDYQKVLKKYQSALRQRNALLSKKMNGYKDMILSLDEQLSEASFIITQKRELFITQIRDFLQYSFARIFSQQHLLDLKLQTPFSGQTIDIIKEKFTEKLAKDEVIGHTTIGIHRDDFQFIFDGMNALEYCSLGQQKMSYLSLIFAYIELFRYKFKAYPIVLIDDVSGELDAQRWANLISYMGDKDFQVLITTANEGFKQELAKIENVNQIMVDQGRIYTVQ